VRPARRAGVLLERVPLDDAETYRQLSSGTTTAVFQLESRGMRDLISAARHDRFEDVLDASPVPARPMDHASGVNIEAQARQARPTTWIRGWSRSSADLRLMVYQEQV